MKTSQSVKALYNNEYQDFSHALYLIWCQTQELRIEQPENEVQHLFNQQLQLLEEASNLLIRYDQEYMAEEPDETFYEYVAHRMHHEGVTEIVLQQIENLLELAKDCDLWKAAIYLPEKRS